MQPSPPLMEKVPARSLFFERDFQLTGLQQMKSKTFLFFAFNLLLVGNPSAQIVYTDLNPDSIVAGTIQNPTAQFNLDLDKDGAADFNIRHNNFSGYIQAEFYTNFGQVGEIMTNGTGAPIALSANDDINSSQPDWVCTAGQSSNSALFMSTNGANFVGEGDKFVGLRIKLNGQWHYGWVCIDIPADTSQIIIKGYAYELSANTSIDAGQKVTGINDAAGEDRNLVSVYPDPFIVSTTIQIPKVMERVTFSLYNLYGQKIRSIKCIAENKIILDRGNLSPGIYFYKLEAEEKKGGCGKLTIAD